jgi:hypothetical protein
MPSSQFYMDNWVAYLDPTTSIVSALLFSWAYYKAFFFLDSAASAGLVIYYIKFN